MEFFDIILIIAFIIFMIFGAIPDKTWTKLNKEIEKNRKRFLS